MALITVDDIELLLGQTLDSDDETVIDMYITFAVGEIESYLGRTITIQSFTEEVIPDADGRAFLSNTPVITVDSVSVDGESKPTDYYIVTPWGLENIYYKNRGGVITYWDLSDPQRVVDQFYEPEIVVEYTSGLDTPDAVNSLIAAGVIRKWNERKTQIDRMNSGGDGINQIKVEDYFIKYEDSNTFQTSSYIAGANPITIFRSEKDFINIKGFRRRSIA
jgi:hypothetical protein